MLRYLILLIAIINFKFVFANECEIHLNALFSRAQNYNLHTGSLIEVDLRDRIDMNSLTNGSIIYLGSGPDVLNLLATFANAKEFHLLDILTGWGAGPGEVILEVIRRLKHLAKDHEINIVEPGFTQFVPAEKLQPPKGFRNWNSRDPIAQEHFQFSAEHWRKWGYPDQQQMDTRYLEPLVIEFILADDKSQLVRKLYFHHLDYSIDEHLLRLNSHVQSPLKGLFVSGVATPKKLPQFISNLTSGGYFVLEHYLGDDWAIDYLKPLGSLKYHEPHAIDYRGEQVRYMIFQKD
ncbi:MAG: hypothetical protein KDD40_01425 [Bdellovibrionales bacterium]|nr:hypothetical protein [Bdellovibrionales bacterium]